MSNKINRQIILVKRPSGKPQPDDFSLVDASVPVPEEGQVLCKTIYLSLDPYMRGRMNDSKSYADPVKINEVMTGGTVGQVLKSRSTNFQQGDIVYGYGGWQDYWASEGKALRKI